MNNRAARGVNVAETGNAAEGANRAARVFRGAGARKLRGSRGPGDGELAHDAGGAIRDVRGFGMLIPLTKRKSANES